MPRRPQIPGLPRLPGVPSGRRLPRHATPAGVVTALIALAVTPWLQRQGGAPAPNNPAPETTTSTRGAPRPAGPTPDAPSTRRLTACADLIRQAIDDQRSDVMVECSGEIIKVLDDDNDGSRHQRFLVRLDNGAVTKVSHNIDLAPRVPAGKGDRIDFRGEFDWNDLGGAVHWTHHDPRGKREGGWIRFKGETYE